MILILDTPAISSELERVIIEAQEKLYLISPYWKISDRYKKLLLEVDKQNLDFKIIYRPRKLNASEREWLERLQTLNLNKCDNLHAKCYLNEKEVIISSMNFHESSQEKNKEIGIVIYKSENEQLYEAVLREMKKIIELSKNTKAPTIRKGGGYCIRCRAQITLDPKKPYCEKDYLNLKSYGNLKHIEKNGKCHICGKPNASSMKKPVCKECFKKNKQLFKV